jgi:hypothetical protein
MAGGVSTMKTEILLSLLSCGVGTALALFAYATPGTQLAISMLAGALMGFGLMLVCPQFKSVLARFALVIAMLVAWNLLLLILVGCLK